MKHKTTVDVLRNLLSVIAVREAKRHFTLHFIRLGEHPGTLSGDAEPISDQTVSLKRASVSMVSVEINPT